MTLSLSLFSNPNPNPNPNVNPNPNPNPNSNPNPNPNPNPYPYPKYYPLIYIYTLSLCLTLLPYTLYPIPYTLGPKDLRPPPSPPRRDSENTLLFYSRRCCYGYMSRFPLFTFSPTTFVVSNAPPAVVPPLPWCWFLANLSVPAAESWHAAQQGCIPPHWTISALTMASFQLLGQTA